MKALPAFRPVGDGDQPPGQDDRAHRQADAGGPVGDGGQHGDWPAIDGQMGRKRARLAAGRCGLSAIKALSERRNRDRAEFRGGHAFQSTARSRDCAAIALSRGLRQILALRGQMRESTASTDLTLPAMPVAGRGRLRPLGMAILSLMFLSVAFWNGFPLIFYDTGAYLLEGLGQSSWSSARRSMPNCCSWPAALSACGRS